MRKELFFLLFLAWYWGIAYGQVCRSNTGYLSSEIICESPQAVSVTKCRGFAGGTPCVSVRVSWAVYRNWRALEEANSNQDQRVTLCGMYMLEKGELRQLTAAKYVLATLALKPGFVDSGYHGKVLFDEVSNALEARLWCSFK